MIKKSLNTTRFMKSLKIESFLEVFYPTKKKGNISYFVILS